MLDAVKHHSLEKERRREEIIYIYIYIEREKKKCIYPALLVTNLNERCQNLLAC
jgi:hypothetical protein